MARVSSTSVVNPLPRDRSPSSCRRTWAGRRERGRQSINHPAVSDQLQGATRSVNNESRGLSICSHVKGESIGRFGYASKPSIENIIDRLVKMIGRLDTNERTRGIRIVFESVTIYFHLKKGNLCNDRYPGIFFRYALPTPRLENKTREE